MAEPAEVAGFCTILFSWVLPKEGGRGRQRWQRYRITIIQAHTMGKSTRWLALKVPTHGCRYGLIDDGYLMLTST
jgi:hypothetical protein